MLRGSKPVAALDSEVIENDLLNPNPWDTILTMHCKARKLQLSVLNQPNHAKASAKCDGCHSCGHYSSSGGSSGSGAAPDAGSGKVRDPTKASSNTAPGGSGLRTEDTYGSRLLTRKEMRRTYLKDCASRLAAAEFCKISICIILCCSNTFLYPRNPTVAEVGQSRDVMRTFAERENRISSHATLLEAPELTVCEIQELQQHGYFKRMAATTVHQNVRKLRQSYSLKSREERNIHILGLLWDDATCQVRWHSILVL